MLNNLEQFSIQSNNENTLTITKEELLKIDESLKENNFKVNKGEYITFNIYPDNTFITLETTTNKQDGIMQYKYFTELCNNKLLFRDIYKFKDEKNNYIRSDINNFIKANLNIRFIHITIRKDLWDYIIPNINNISITLYNIDWITIFADNEEIPSVFNIYKL